MLWIVLVIVVIALGVLLVVKQQGRGAGASAACLNKCEPGPFNLITSEIGHNQPLA